MKKYQDYTHYRRWKSMLSRCYNKNHTYYYNYGGRGITVCEEWKNSYQNFCDWVKKSGYKKGLTLDRIDNNKGYSPENCRWATRKQQGRNQRTNKKITINGKTKLMCEWAEISGISEKNISKRIKRGWTNEELLKPLKRTQQYITYDGKTLTISEWSKILRIPYTTIIGRIKKGLNPFENHDKLRKEASRKAISKKIMQYDKNGNFIKEWSSIIEASKKMGVSPPSISANLRGLTKTSCGYIWKYEQEVDISERKKTNIKI